MNRIKSCCYFLKFPYRFVMIILLMIMMATGAYGQGWTFSIQLKSPGCEGVGSYVTQANALLSSINTMGIPTKSECDAIRQQILAIKVSGPNGNGGTCSVYYSCGECVGSDISGTSGAGVVGTVSINGLAQGLAFFSTHPSSDYENWYNDLLVKFQSMGVDLKGYISGDGLATSDANFNQGYADQIAEFEKKANDDITYQKPEQGGVVDLTGKSAFEGKVVDPGKMNPGESKDYVKLFDPPALDYPDPVAVPKPSYTPSNAENVKDNEIESYKNPYVETGLEVAKSVTDILVPNELVGFGLKAGFNLVAEDVNAYIACSGSGPCPDTKTILTNSLNRTVDDAKEAIQDKITDGASGIVTNYVGKKLGISDKAIKKANDTWEKISTASDAFDTGYEFGTEINK